MAAIETDGNFSGKPAAGPKNVQHFQHDARRAAFRFAPPPTNPSDQGAIKQRRDDRADDQQCGPDKQAYRYMFPLHVNYSPGLPRGAAIDAGSYRVAWASHRSLR
jgi:hypothetical protein